MTTPPTSVLRYVLVAVLLTGVSLLFVAMSISVLPDYLLSRSNEKDWAALSPSRRFQEIGLARESLLQGLASVVIVAGAATGLHQLRLNRAGLTAARQANYVDAFTRAAEQLTSSTPAMALAGVVALTELARSDTGKAPGIISVLQQFVRSPLHVSDLKRVQVVAIREVAGLGYRLHLAGASLPHAELRGVNLDDSSLADCDLRDAVLVGATLSRADLRGCDMSRADLRGADLSGAVFDARTRLLNIRTDAATRGMRAPDQAPAAADS